MAMWILVAGPHLWERAHMSRAVLTSGLRVLCGSNGASGSAGAAAVAGLLPLGVEGLVVALAQHVQDQEVRGAAVPVAGGIQPAAQRLCDDHRAPAVQAQFDDHLEHRRRRVQQVGSCLGSWPS
eukprot:SAG22_NODE_1751_length_3659_cov_67.046067_4_plen_124_part_00